MKFGVFVHPIRPKLYLNDLVKVIQDKGFSYSNNDPDIAIVAGGDGTFSHYGRILRIPMLFVGVKDDEVLGSKARLGEVLIKDLPKALAVIDNGNYTLERRRMFSVSLKRTKNQGFTSKVTAVDVLTDIYIERAIFSGCLRYLLSVKVHKGKTATNNLNFAEYAIGNGVIISTSLGALGYYSYPDRIRIAKASRNSNSNNSNNNHESNKTFADDRIGICHIIPTFLVRKATLNNEKRVKKRPPLISCIRYTIPYQSTIKINLLRNSDARLYGTTSHSRGLAFKSADEIAVRPSRRIAKIIRLYFTRRHRT